MMEVFLGTQVHVMAGLGYSPDDKGITLYNKHLSDLMQNLEPQMQEKLRTSSRDLWREVLFKAFGINKDQQSQKELSIVDARSFMFKVAQKMQEPQILELIAKNTANIIQAPSPQVEFQMKNVAVQKVLVEQVYLGGNPSLVQQCGFPQGEIGYVLMQSAIAEHQNDPLISQYIGSAMGRVLESAGIDIIAAMKQVQQS